MTQRWHILSDFEMDEIDSANQIEGVRSVLLPNELLRLRRFEASLLEAVKEINGNVIKLPT